jgi:diphosphomevalonate decarboxylase
MSMQATAIAQPNIALIKYWGKRDIDRNLPAVGSISITLSELHTQVSVDLSAGLSADALFVNDEKNQAMLPRISACLDRVLGSDRPPARVESRSNFPIAAGLASSASAFAATTLAAANAASLSLGTEKLAQLAGASSGSAARSLYGGFTELRNCGDSIELTSLCDKDSWPLKVVVAITASGPKATGSTEAMEISRKSSPFYNNWISQQEHDLELARTAIASQDFEQLAAISEHNCLKMHSVMWASRPPMVFWNAATMRCLQTVRRLQGEGCQVFFTIDAGPQVKAVCLPDDADAVRRALQETPGVEKIMMSGLGSAARRVEKQ